MIPEIVLRLPVATFRLLVLIVVSPLIGASSGTANVAFSSSSVLTAGIPLLSNHVVHVNAAAAPGGDGSDWASAFTDLQLALAAAQNGDEIWVAAGIYTPGNDRTDTFQLVDGIALYGGFDGTESVRQERNWQTNVTILSGDIGNPNDNSDNSYHVVTGSNTNSSAILDGFTITAGNADGDSVPNYDGGGMYNNSGNPSLSNITFSDNHAHFGGGMFNVISSPSLTNVTFSGNRARSDGGGMYNFNSHPTLINVDFSGNSAYVIGSGGGLSNRGDSNPSLINVIFSGNFAAGSGGGMFNHNSSPTLTNVAFSGNRATGVGGGMFNQNGSPDIQNSIFWHNQDTNGLGTASASLAVGIGLRPISRHSLIQGCNPDGNWDPNCGTNDNSLPDADPLFVATPDPASAPSLNGNLRLRPVSPAIDSGNDDFVTAATDLDGFSRNVGANVDLGAYESQYERQCGGFVAGIPYVLGPTQPVTLVFSDPGDVDCVTVTYFPTDHPYAGGDAANVATGRYWAINTTGQYYTAVLSLPHQDLFDPKACRWLEGVGPGAGWDCARDDFTSENVRRGGITQFSDWSVGNQVGPTAVTRQAWLISVEPQPRTAAVGALLLLLVLTTTLLLYAWIRAFSR